MTPTGYDFSVSTLGKAHALKAAGAECIWRYGSPSTANHPGKQLSIEELDHLHSVGLLVGIIFEKFATVEEFKNPQKTADEALEFLTKIGAPKTGKVGAMFCVDFDCGPLDEAKWVMPSFEHVHNALKAESYLTEGYGSWRILTNLKAKGFIHGALLAQSTGWQPYSKVGMTAVQGPTCEVAGLPADGQTLSAGCTWQDLGAW